jgi:site-specific recombinase XerD
VAAYIELMPGSKPTIKQKLAAIRMLYNFLVIRQLVPVNPTASVRGPKDVVKRGKTTVWSREDAKTGLKARSQSVRSSGFSFNCWRGAYSYCVETQLSI